MLLQTRNAGSGSIGIHQVQVYMGTEALQRERKRQTRKVEAQLEAGYGRWCELHGEKHLVALRDNNGATGYLAQRYVPQTNEAGAASKLHKKGLVPHKRTLCLRKIARRYNCTNALYPFYMAAACHRGGSYCRNTQQIGKSYWFSSF